MTINEDDLLPADDAEEPGAMTEEEIDRNLVGSFPASDPPSWTLGTDHVSPVTDEPETSEE